MGELLHLNKEMPPSQFPLTDEEKRILSGTDTLKELQRLRKENRYLSFLVWKLSIRDLATQDEKYAHNLARAYVSTREKDWGVPDV